MDVGWISELHWGIVVPHTWAVASGNALFVKIKVKVDDL